MIHKILIVEDEAIIGMAMAAELEDAGFEIIDVCPTGKEALAIIKHEVPDLVILDVKLANGMTGLETLLEIRKLASPYFFIVSGNSDSLTVQEVRNLQVDDFFVKPVQTLSLIRRIGELNSEPGAA